MIPALIIGRAGSTGFKDKNIKPILGRPLMSYPIHAARHSRHIAQKHIYLSTDSLQMKEVGAALGCQLIDRPAWLATNEALAEDAFIHGFQEIVKRAGEPVEAAVLQFCNSATILASTIDLAIEKLRSDPTSDSAATVSCYNMWSPLRARKIENGLLKRFVPDEILGTDLSCDRGSQGNTYFADCSAFVCRPQCFEPGYGDLPFRWMGRKILPVEQWGGLDVDYEWQLGQVQFWLKQHGFTETTTPYDAA